ncbi:hypothetical protein EB118_17500 [bacterium]|nr:hypothetical protein [bacterium]NDC96452.1 hypothetical protein [bacterium]NDD85308.1 hypothetical protein [bacterium]NDG31854.1 hypothetical protein [bacterium]
MPVWLVYIPTIIQALVQLAKLLLDLAKEKKSDDIKECAIAIEDARKSGDTAKLMQLIEKMRKGQSCD